MKTYQETIQFIAEVRAQMLAFPKAPMGTYIPEAAVAIIYGIAEEVVYTDAQMATLARATELTTK
jgi:hypothetical protein